LLYRREARVPEVLCAYDQLVPVGELKPNPRNPNTHSKDQIRLLVKLIEYHGWRVPVTVSKRSGLIVRGHGRYMAAQKAGWDVPVDLQDYESDEDEYADLIADNRVAELAVIDTGILKDLLQELDSGAMDMELTGYTDDVLERMMTAIHKPEALPEIDIEGAGELTRRIIVVFESSEEEREFWASLGKEAPDQEGRVVYPWHEIRP
jgi:ParB-like chromosome segregation protein Spo0J